MHVFLQNFCGVFELKKQIFLLQKLDFSIFDRCYLNKTLQWLFFQVIQALILIRKQYLEKEISDQKDTSLLLSCM